jgi:succinoglycan biosynthesis protein ExoA
MAFTRRELCRSRSLLPAATEQASGPFLAGAMPADLVSIVIPARNEEHSIGACLDSVLGQDVPDIEVIVVDGSSTDATARIVTDYARRDQRVRLLRNPDAIVPKSLNIGAADARGRWLVRVDAHARIAPGYVRRAVRHLADGRWGGVGGRKDGVGTTPAGRAIAAAMASRFGVGNSAYHYGTSCRPAEHVPFGAYPTDLVRALGGWNENLAVNQDFEFDYRVRRSGHQLLFDPALKIEWHCRQSISALFAQYRRYGRGKARVAWLHPGSVRTRHLAAPALVVWLATAAIAARRHPRVAATAVVPYLGAVAAASAATARKVPVGSRRHLPAAFVAMHIGWGLGFWSGLAALLARRPSARDTGPALVGDQAPSVIAGDDIAGRPPSSTISSSAASSGTVVNVHGPAGRRPFTDASSCTR